MLQENVRDHRKRTIYSGIHILQLQRIGHGAGMARTRRGHVARTRSGRTWHVTCVTGWLRR